MTFAEHRGSYERQTKKRKSYKLNMFCTASFIRGIFCYMDQIAKLAFLLKAY